MQNGTKSERMASTSPRQTNTLVTFHLQDVAAIFQVSKTGCKRKWHSISRRKIQLTTYGTHEFMGKTFQAAHLTHKRFLTINQSCNFFLISAKLNFHRPLEGSMVRNHSCVSCAAWNVIPRNSLSLRIPLWTPPWNSLCHPLWNPL